MRVRITPKYKFVCDRCGKEEFLDNEDEYIEYPTVTFSKQTSIVQMPIKTEGEVCEDCLAEFWELAENFFDEVNKERSENGT